MNCILFISFFYVYIDCQHMHCMNNIKHHNHIHAEIKSRLNSLNTYYHSLQKFLSSCLLSKNMKIKIYRAIIMSVARETWSITL
jgi:hypothetical protein